MTVKEGTICSLIQAFPVLLILAQNHNKCLKTPLVYKPPSPTHSPEYYEALDALFQSLYGHGYQEGHSFQGGHTYQGGHSYPSGHSHQGHNYHTSYPVTTSGCQYYAYGSYGKKYATYGKPCYQYVYTTNGHHPGNLYGYPGYGIKGNIYALDGNYTSNYAPNQVYNSKNKYKVIVKKTRIGGKRKDTHLRLTGLPENATNSSETSGEQPNFKMTALKVDNTNINPDDEIEGERVTERSSKQRINRKGERACKSGECIPLRSCGVFMKIIQDMKKTGRSVQLRGHCGFEGRHPKVCCPVSPTANITTVMTKPKLPDVGSIASPPSAVDEILES